MKKQVCIIFFLFSVFLKGDAEFGFFPISIQPSATDQEINSNQNFPLINITTSYFIEGAGKHESSISNNSFLNSCSDSTYTMFYDCESLEKIHEAVNKILIQAGIQLISPQGSARSPSVILSRFPSESLFNFRVYSINTGVNVKKYRHKFVGNERLVEALFLSHANVLSLGLADQLETQPEYFAELIIRIVKSIGVGEDAAIAGLYYPSTKRKRYSNSKIKIKKSPYPKNTTKYIIAVGYDDVDNDTDLARVIAHEIGHAFGLCHVSEKENKGNFMVGHGLKNTNINYEQSLIMRKNIQSFINHGKPKFLQTDECLD